MPVKRTERPAGVPVPQVGALDGGEVGVPQVGGGVPRPVVVGGGVGPQLGVLPPPGVSGDEGLGHAGQGVEQLGERPPGVAAAAVPGLVCVRHATCNICETVRHDMGQHSKKISRNVLVQT